jgi:hypothetical protein
MNLALSPVKKESFKSPTRDIQSLLTMEKDRKKKKEGPKHFFVPKRD